MPYALAIVPGERRALTTAELADARRWVVGLERWVEQTYALPAGVELTRPVVVDEVEVQHAAGDGATLCGIPAERYEVHRSTFRPESMRACPACRRVANPYGRDEYVPPLTHLDEREALALVGRRIGMYVGVGTLDRVVHLLHGYATGSSRRAAYWSFTGFAEWLETRRGAPRTPLGWPQMVVHLALPDTDVSWADLPREQSERTVAVLFELLDEYLAEIGSPPDDGAQAVRVDA